MTIAKVGEVGSGFSVALDARDGSLRIVGEGFWSEDVADSFLPTCSDALNAHPRVNRFVFDFRLLKPLRDAGQAGFLRVLQALKSRPHTAITLLTASPLTKLQLLRIVKESGSSDWVQFR